MNSQRLLKRSIAAMANSKMSPFSTAVVAAMRKLYPEKLADSSFDNTGLLLEAPHRPHLKNSVLLTVDLTQAVADEAIARKDSIIITYHPIIFRPLKSLTLANTQQNTLLRLAQEGISVYSPHTAVDAAPGGLNDWLADCASSGHVGYGFKAIEGATRSVIQAVKDAPPGFEDAGYGRIVRFAQPQTLVSIMARISVILRLTNVSLAVPQSTKPEEEPKIQISSIGICAGSGGSLLNGLDVDLLFTGELSHHEALAATEQGRCVITTFHSNSERGYISGPMWEKLKIALKETQTSETAGFDIAFSSADRDPYETVGRGNSKGWLGW